MNIIVSLVDLPWTPVAYFRYVGPTVQARRASRSKSVAPWMAANGLMGQVRYGVSHDDPVITEPTKCRYDACVGTRRPSALVSGQPQRTTLAGGRYACTPLRRHHRPDRRRLAAAACAAGCRQAACSSTTGRSSSTTRKAATFDPSTGVFDSELCIPVSSFMKCHEERIFDDPFPLLQVRGVERRFDRHAGAAGHRPRRRRERLRHHARPQRLRQEHAAAHRRRAGHADRRRGAARRPAHRRTGRRPRHGVPELHAVPVAHRARQRLLRPARARPAARAAGRDRARLHRQGGAGRLRDTTSRSSCRAACSSAPRSRARSPTTRGCC